MHRLRLPVKTLSFSLYTEQIGLQLRLSSAVSLALGGPLNSGALDFPILPIPHCYATAHCYSRPTCTLRLYRLVTFGVDSALARGAGRNGYKVFVDPHFLIYLVLLYFSSALMTIKRPQLQSAINVFFKLNFFKTTCKHCWNY